MLSGNGVARGKGAYYACYVLDDFLQQGEPYAGWADQYTVDDLKPAHARSYEPRSVNTGTTVRLVNLMMDYYKLTADTRFLSGIPAAIRFGINEITGIGCEEMEESVD